MPIQKTTTLVALVAGVLTLFATTNDSRADLVVNVEGTPGSGQTSWSFSGSYTVATGNTVNSGWHTGVPTAWYDIGNFTNTHDNEYVNFSSGNAQLVGSISGNLSIDGVYLDLDGVSGGDDWGFTSQSSHTYATGETLTFSGTSDLDFDINTFIPTTLTSTGSGATIQINFTSTAVPEPSSLALMGLIGLVGLGRRRRITTDK